MCQKTGPVDPEAPRPMGRCATSPTEGEAFGSLGARPPWTPPLRADQLSGLRKQIIEFQWLTQDTCEPEILELAWKETSRRDDQDWDIREGAEGFLTRPELEAVHRPHPEIEDDQFRPQTTLAEQGQSFDAI